MTAPGHRSRCEHGDEGHRAPILTARNAAVHPGGRRDPERVSAGLRDPKPSDRSPPRLRRTWRRRRMSSVTFQSTPPYGGSPHFNPFHLLRKIGLLREPPRRTASRAVVSTRIAMRSFINQHLIACANLPGIPCALGVRAGRNALPPQPAIVTRNAGSPIMRRDRKDPSDGIRDALLTAHDLPPKAPTAPSSPEASTYSRNSLRRAAE